MGEGRVMAMGFEADAKPGDLLIVATDGLWRHSSRMRIRELVARRTPIVEVADELVELARRTTGKLQDDVAIVICEIRIGAAISVGPGR
jgi:serine/threonine protein phosphatase PrpC